MSMYNSREYNNKYSKTSGRLWQYYRDDPNDNAVHSKAFKFKNNIIGKTALSDITKDVEIAVPLIFLMPLINCEINLILTWSENWFISSATRKFAVTDTKLYVLVVTLST